MDLSQRALPVIDKIYQAATDPDRWNDVVQAVSEVLGGSAVGFGILDPTDPLAGDAYLCKISVEYRRSFPEKLIEGLPFAGHFGEANSGRFLSYAEFFPDIRVGESEFYRTWMAPQGFAPEWPIGCGLFRPGGVPVMWMYAWRFAGAGPFGAEEIAFGDTLLPHLERAFEIRRSLLSTGHERRALGEVVDRLPTGVILLDAKGRMVSKNQAAERILKLEDGLVEGPSGPRVSCPRGRASLKRLIASALEPEAGAELQAGGFVAIERPSGRRSFVCMVTPLLDAPGGSDSDAALALFVSDPEAGRVSETQVLETVYQLTNAEAELVRLLSSGLSLEQAAQKRGVTINTARGQLKQVFAKTDTKRQGELVRLVLMGVGTMRDL